MTNKGDFQSILHSLWELHCLWVSLSGMQILLLSKNCFPYLWDILNSCFNGFFDFYS